MPCIRPLFLFLAQPEKDDKTTDNQPLLKNFDQILGCRSREETDTRLSVAPRRPKSESITKASHTDGPTPYSIASSRPTAAGRRR